MGDESRFPDLSRVLAALSSVPQARFLGIRCDEIGPGRAILSMPYQDRLIGNPKTAVIHGGVITTLLDTLSWLVASTSVSEQTAVATLDLRIDYLRPATPLEPIRAAGECYKLTSSVAFTRGVAYHDNRDDPIAHLTGTCMLGSTGFSAAKGGTAPTLGGQGHDR
ncbi:MAG: PaaI family thioesterase [Rhodospirillales bacterium]